MCVLLVITIYMNKYKNINTFCLIILTTISIAGVLAYTQAIMIPFTLSIFLYLILSPIMLVLNQKFKTPKWMAFLITLILFLIISLLAIFFISTSIDTFLRSKDQYSETITGSAIFIANKISQFGFNLSREEVLIKLQEFPFLSILKSFTFSMMALFSDAMLVIIFTIFLLTGESKSSNTISIIEEIKKSVSKYVGIKLFTSLSTGLIALIIYLSFGVELAFMFSFFAVMLNFIPNIGSIIAVIIPIPVLLLQFGLHWQTFTILIVSVLSQMIIGNIIEPKLMGNSVGLHPVTILLFLTFWGLIWGIPGMFLSVPITATIKIIVAKFDFTKPVAHLLEGRWP